MFLLWNRVPWITCYYRDCFYFGGFVAAFGLPHYRQSSSRLWSLYFILTLCGCSMAISIYFSVLLGFISFFYIYMAKLYLWNISKNLIINFYIGIRQSFPILIIIACYFIIVKFLLPNLDLQVLRFIFITTYYLSFIYINFNKLMFYIKIFHFNIMINTMIIVYLILLPIIIFTISLEIVDSIIYIYDPVRDISPDVPYDRTRSNPLGGGGDQGYGRPNGGGGDPGNNNQPGGNRPPTPPNRDPMGSREQFGQRPQHPIDLTNDDNINANPRVIPGDLYDKIEGQNYMTMERNGHFKSIYMNTYQNYNLTPHDKQTLADIFRNHRNYVVSVSGLIKLRGTGPRPPHCDEFMRDIIKGPYSD